MRIIIKMEISLLIKTREDEKTGIWLSYNPDLDLYSQGLTKEEAIEALEMGIRTHLSLCRERNLSKISKKLL